MEFVVYGLALFQLYFIGYCAKYYRMKNFYYLIWADAIKSNRKYKPNMTDWKLTLFVLITMSNALNLFAIDVLINLLFIETPLIKINYFPGTMLDSAAGFLIQFASPFIILNYFLIFYKNRYEKIIERYPIIKGRPALIYSMCSILIGVLSAVFYGIFH